VTALLDTHAVIWALEGDRRLGTKARRVVASADASGLCISNITLLEIALLIHKGRISPTGTSEALLTETASHFQTLPITASIAALAYQQTLPQGDPFDRVIVATARTHRLKLVTKDVAIAASGLVETIW